MKVESLKDSLRKHVVTKTKGKTVGWHIHNIFSGGALKREEKQLRCQIVEKLVTDALRLSGSLITVGEYRAYQNKHRRSYVNASLSSTGQQLLRDTVNAIDTQPVSRAISK